MNLSFNTQGNLYQTIELTYEEFNQHFGTNQRRMEQIKNAENIERKFPQFFDVKEIGRIHKNLQCHIFHFDENYKRLFNLLSEDRDGNPKGFVKLNLKDLLTYYDQK